MRTPISGTSGPPPVDYAYSTSVETIRELPAFSPAYLGSQTDTYYDIGEARPQVFSAAASPSGVAWAWSPASALTLAEANGQTPTSGDLLVGYTEDLTDLSNESTAAGYTVEPRTRGDVYWDGTRFVVAYVEAGTGLVQVKELGTDLALSDIDSFAHGVASTEGMTINIVAPGLLWLSKVEQGYVWAGQAGYSSAPSSWARLYSHPDLTWWHHTSFRAVSFQTRTCFYCQHRLGMGVSHEYSDGYLSAAVPIPDGDQDYAYQFLRICDVTEHNGMLWAVLERGLLNSDDRVSAWFTSLAYSRDGLTWTDWAGVAGYPVRGSFVVLGDEVAVVGVGHSSISPGVRLAGNGTWTPLGGVAGYDLMQAQDAPAQGRMAVVHDGTTTVIDSGETLCRTFSLNGAQYVLFMESVDRPVGSHSYVGRTEQVASRGPLKYAALYRATVDEAFDSGLSRYDRYVTFSVVGKRGDWTIDGEQLTVENDVVDEESAPATCVIPDHLSLDDFHFATRFSRLGIGTGLIFFYVDEDNYWRFGYDGAGYELVQIADGTETVLGAWSLDPSDVPYLMLQYVGGQVLLHVSSPTTLADGENAPERGEWRLIAKVLPGTAPTMDTFQVGFSARTGDRVFFSLLRVGYTQWTIGRVAQAIAARSGLQLDVYSPYTKDGAWLTLDGTLDYSSQRLRHVDLEMEVDLTGGDLSFALGLQRAEWGYGGILVTLAQTQLTYSEFVYTTPDQPGIATVRSTFPLLHALDNVCHVRVCLLPEPLNRYSLLQVYVCGCLAWCMPLPALQPGYVGITGTDVKLRNLRASGLAYPVDVHVWPYGASALEQIRQLTRDSLWLLVERDDLTAQLVPIDYSAGSLGEVEATATVVDYVSDDEAWASLVKVEGAEVIGYYADPRLLSEGMRPLETSAPNLWTEEECVTMAAQHADLLYSRRNGKGLVGLLDPRVEVMDRMAIDGATYIVENVRYQVASPRQEPYAMMELRLRLDISE